jgi:hypothetical protein
MIHVIHQLQRRWKDGRSKLLLPLAMLAVAAILAGLALLFGG